MMTDSFTGGVTYKVNPAGSDITDFNPTTDRLDFGEISVHGLILGALPDGTAGIVNPWADQVQALQGLSWNDLSLNNLGVVGNEHLRQDIGAVLSWEQNIGARDSNTVYVRSHQFGVQEVITGFDPQTQKLNFLYTGTRERLSVIDTDQGLLIQFEPTNQSVLLAGVQRSDLIGANLEFHHDQVMEDNLEVPFGFTAEEVSLVSRAGLLTPQAPSGASTDGDQVRAGLMVNPDSTEIAVESAHSMHDHSMPADGMSADGIGSLPSSSGDLQASVAGQLYSGGMSGTLTLSNSSAVVQSNWSFSFLTNQPGFESWSAESSVTDLGGGTYQVMITPPAWGLEIPSGGSVDLAFNANSVGLPETGDLTNQLFFDNEPGPGVVAPFPPENSDTSSLAVVEIPPVVEASPVMADGQGLSVSATINGGWSGVFAGEITVTNLGDVSAGIDWSVALVMDAPLTSVSNFEAESELRSDGRYDVSLSPKAWSAPLDPGVSLTSYYQAAGEVTDPAQVFDFGDVVVSDRSVTTLEQTDPPAQITESALSEAAEIESIAIVEPIASNQSNDSGDPPAVIETLPVVEASPVMADGQGLSVSATINGGWSGVFAGEITVTNLGDVSAGIDWSVALVMDAPLTSVSNFEAESELRSDGRYDVSLSPKAWSAPLDPGVSLTSYYQAAGEVTDPAQVFDFGDVVVSDRSVTTLEQTDPPAQITESALSEAAEIESIAIVEPIASNQSNDSGDPPAVIETLPVVEASPVMADGQGLSVSATINGGWSGVFAGEITVTNLGDVSAGIDWSVALVMDAPLTSVSNFEAESELRSDGRYDVSLSPKAWSAPLDPGVSLTSYYQAAGEVTDPAQVFDFGDVVVSDRSVTTLEQTDPPAQITESALSEAAEIESIAIVEPIASNQSNDSGDPPAVIETLPVVEASPVMADGQGLSVSATINGGWSGVFAGEITVTNLGDVSAGIDWSVALVMDAPLTSVSNFEAESELRSDGRYDVSLSPKAWSAPLDPGVSLTSYYQAAGEVTDPAQVFDFGDVVVSDRSVTTLEQTDPPAQITESALSEAAEIESIAIVEPIASNQSNDSGDPPAETSIDVKGASTLSFDVQAPNGEGDKRIVTYFEEWGVYERDINLSDVNGQAMTHLNYSFFDVKADGSVELFDTYAAQEKRFSADDQVSRTFTQAEYQAVDPALIAAYNTDRYTITESADSVTVTSVPVDWNEAGPQDAGNFEQLRRFKELNPDVELGFALGGWTLSDEFSTAFASQIGRDRFVNDVVDIFKTYEFFSVVDFDWEYPGGGGNAGNASSANDGANFALVLEQLRAELDALESQTGGNYEVSIATAGGSEKLANLNLAGIDPYVDFYNVMTYDFHGGWENQTGHQAAMTGDANNYDVTTAVSVFEEAGVDLSKVVLGAPAYTRAWGGVEDGGTFGYQQSGSGAEAEGSFEAGVYDYKDIVTGVITGQTDLYWDDDNKAAFVYNGDEWSSIETIATIAGKAAYIQAKGLGGMMFWALSNDAEGELSLIETADDILRQGASYALTVENAPEFDYILGGNGEFSISDFTALT